MLEADLEDGAQAIGLGDRGRLAAARRTAWSAPVRPTAASPAAGLGTAHRGEREPVPYRDRPWTDGLAFAGGGVWARLDDDRRTVRTYKVVDSLVLWAAGQANGQQIVATHLLPECGLGPASANGVGEAWRKQASIAFGLVNCGPLAGTRWCSRRG